MLERRLNWKAACLFVFANPQWRTQIFRGGLWLLLCPPVGWLMALGYRKEVVMNLVGGTHPVLPVWPGQARRFFSEGAKAVGVILVYFAPFFALFWGLGVDDPSVLGTRISELVVFFVAIVVLAPVFLPALPVWYAGRYEWFVLTDAEATGLAILFMFTTYIIPAGFMQVSRSGRFRDALCFRAVVRVFREHAWAYTEAWVCSGFMTLAALASGPLAPFGIIWSYQGIVYCFNEVLTASSDPEVRSRMEKSHFPALGARTRPRTEVEMGGVLGSGRGDPAMFVVGAATWAVVAMSVTEGGAQVYLRGRTGLRSRVELSTVWRPFLTASRGYVDHFVEVTRREDVLELRPVCAALRLGPVRMPLPRRLTPRFRPTPVRPGEPSWRP